MKKRGLFIVFLIIISIVSIYIFIPSVLLVSSVCTINVTENECRQFTIENNKNWSKWWPEDNPVHQTAFFIYNESEYSITNRSINVIEIQIIKGNDTFKSHLILHPFKLDSIGVVWKTTIRSSNNPFTKIRQYQLAKEIKNNFSNLLLHLKTFLEKEENIYSFNIQRTMVKDTLLVSTKFSTTKYPSLKEVYNGIAKLKKVIVFNNANETGKPMMYVYKMNDKEFETMLAIPIDKQILVKDPIIIKKMIIGNLLVADVQGGRALIDSAYRALSQYILDYHLTSPAIPYESFITNRQIEPDSTKWETKIYYPIF